MEQPSSYTWPWFDVKLVRIIHVHLFFGSILNLHVPVHARGHGLIPVHVRLVCMCLFVFLEDFRFAHPSLYMWSWFDYGGWIQRIFRAFFSSHIFSTMEERTS